MLFPCSHREVVIQKKYEDMLALLAQWRETVTHQSDGNIQVWVGREGGRGRKVGGRRYRGRGGWRRKGEEREEGGEAGGGR